MTSKLQKTATEQKIPIQVLNPYVASKKYTYRHVQASEDLSELIDSHWVMHWDLQAESPFKLEIASSPFVAFTFTPFGSFLTGITTGVYDYTIMGKGTLYGTLIKPGRFRGLYGKPVSGITNKELPTHTVFPSIDETANKRIQSSSDDAVGISLIENSIRALPYHTDNNARLVEQIIDFASASPTYSTKQLADYFSMSDRRLQELFHDYVGVGVKWIVVRKRLQKAMSIASQASEKPNWTEIAVDLNYSDQSHFINDFKRIVGMSPQMYYKLQAESRT